MKNAINLIFILTISCQMTAQEWQTPAIDGYGKIKYYEDAAEKPDTSLTYKIIFNIESDKQKDGVNVGLWKIARTLNLLKAGKVADEKVNLVAVIHGQATYTVLSDEKYQERLKKPNPNIELLRLLNENGVTIFVCGQATASRDLEKEDLNENVQLALSALTVLPNYQLRGYALMP